jgi:hypothetical protein
MNELEIIQSGHIWLDPQARSSAHRRRFACTFISPGYIKKADGTDSNIYMPAKTLRLAVDKFNAKPVYLDHPELFGFGWRQAPQVKDMAGITFDAAWSDEENAVIGGIRLYDEDPRSPGAFIGILFDQILADKAAGREVPPTGLSAVLYVQREQDDDTGDTVFTEIRHVESVDFVYSPGAAGYVRAALSTAGWYDQNPTRLWLMPDAHIGHPSIVGGTQPPKSHGGIEMLEETRTTAEDGGTGPVRPVQGTTEQQAPPSRVPSAPTVSQETSQDMSLADAVARIEHIAAQMNARLQPAPSSDVEVLTARLDSLADLLAADEEERTIQGMGQEILYGGFTGFDQIQIALDALIGGVRPPDGIRPLTGIREAYHLLSGDFAMTGLFQPDNVYLAAVTASTMAGLVANALNKRVVNAFMEYPQWWAPAVTIEDFSTLQDVRWITLGGVGELPTVSEGAAYTEMTWDDQTETDSFVKKGGYLGITLECIDKDDTRKVQAAPRALAQAAWLTLGKAIAAIHTDNSGYGQTMSDANYLYDSSNHSNEGSTALSFTAWDATKTAMFEQTELNSGETLGYLTRPYLIWVPIELETTAMQVLASDGEPGTADNDINPFAEGNARMERLRAARSRVITVPHWTDATDWVAQADPRLYPSIGLGFRYGRTPEIFSVASPTAGLMFSNDTLPVKVRFFYAVGPTDWRGLYKHLVS